MKRLLILTATLTLLSASAYAWWFFPRFEKEIPGNLCGNFGLLGVITDGIPKVFGGVLQPYAMIETKRVVLVSGEVMIVEAVVKVEKKGKTIYLVAFKSSPLSWIIVAGDTMSVVQSDEKNKKPLEYLSP